jgi:triphosphoribosyl-dephospho-CoA synthase
MVLLLTPVAKAALSGAARDLRAKLRRVLADLSVDDARHAYAAIRQAGPGGVSGQAEAQDVSDEPTVTLRAAMRYAVERDRIAAEYLSDYAITFEHGLPAWRAARAAGLPERAAALEVFLQLLAAFPDTLIARKLGVAAAEQVADGARAVLAAGDPASAARDKALMAFDATLRDPANQRNPGTTADLVAATLFVAFLADGLP